MAETGDDREQAVEQSAGLVAADDPQLAGLREATGLEGPALDRLAGRLALVKQIKGQGGKVGRGQPPS